MTRDDHIMNLKQLYRNMKKEDKMPVIKKYKRSQIIREEIVEAYKTDLPSAIVLLNGKNKQVEKGNWILIHSDGSQSTYSDEEFNKVFEKITLGETFTDKEKSNEPEPSPTSNK